MQHAPGWYIAWSVSMLLVLCPVAHAQDGLDKRLLDRVNAVDAPAFTTALRVSGATAYPLFAGVPTAAWGVALQRDDDAWWRGAFRLTVSEAGTLAATFGLKYAVRRTRPYRRYADVQHRGGDIARYDPYSFPSGHASLAFALVTSSSLSHPRWYVIGPGYVWASSVALSRVWQGVHFPSDVLAGALLGAAVAAGVHLAGDALVPKGWRDEEPAQTVFRVRYSF